MSLSVACAIETALHDQRHQRHLCILLELLTLLMYEDPFKSKLPARICKNTFMQHLQMFADCITASDEKLAVA